MSKTGNKSKEGRKRILSAATETNDVQNKESITNNRIPALKYFMCLHIIDALYIYIYCMQDALTESKVYLLNTAPAVRFPP